MTDDCQEDQLNEPCGRALLSRGVLRPNDAPKQRGVHLKRLSFVANRCESVFLSNQPFRGDFPQLLHIKKRIFSFSSR